MNKKERLNLIKDLVVRYPIDTQEEIVELLKEAGVVATQATISRDIKEAGIIKIPTAKGYIYGLPKTVGAKNQTGNILSIASMNNMINANLIPGSTAVVKRQVMERFESQIFSVMTDDDSMLIILKNESDIPHVMQTIKAW